MIQTTGKHRGVKLLSTVDYCNGNIVWHEDEEYTAETFLRFLNKVTHAYPSGTITMILDNARIHHAKLLEPFLKENKRLTLVFLPPYSPQLNIVEGLWKCLKADVVNNVFYHTVTEIRNNVHAFMQRVMNNPQEIIDRLCVRMESGQLIEFFKFNLYIVRCLLFHLQLCLMKVFTYRLLLLNYEGNPLVKVVPVFRRNNSILQVNP